MRRTVAALLALALHAALPPCALAEPPPTPAPAPPDTVVLSDGTTFRGTVRELARGSHVVIELPDHSTATLPWSNIVRIEHASWAPLPEARRPSENVVVHIESPQPVQLEYRARGERDWTHACDSPCDRAVSPEPEYRVRGSGVRASRAFRLTAGAQRIVLTVDPASSSGFVLGIVGTSVGGAALVIGAVLLLVGAAVSSDHSGVGNSDGSSIEAVGGVLALIGGLAVGGGIVGIVSNARTDVDMRGAPAGPAAFSRPSSPAVTVPIVRLSF